MIALQSCIGFSRSSTRIIRGYTDVFSFLKLPSTPCVLCVVAQSCPALCDPTDCSPPGSSVHWDSPGQNAGVGCQALLQGIFPTQGSNPGLAHCRRILYRLSHQGSLPPRVWSQSTSFLRFTAISHQLPTLHALVYVFRYSLSICPIRPCSRCICKSVLYVWASTPALAVGFLATGPPGTSRDGAFEKAAKAEGVMRWVLTQHGRCPSGERR